MCDIVQMNESDLLVRKLNEQLQMNPDKECKLSSPFSSWNTFPLSALVGLSSASNSQNNLFNAISSMSSVDTKPVEGAVPQEIGDFPIFYSQNPIATNHQV